MYKLHYAPDNASLIIRFALAELGLDYETVLVDRARRAQDSLAYRAITPTGLIPALQAGSTTLFETGAILLWLSEQHRDLAPAPNDPARGDFLKWLFFIANTLHADMRLHFYPERYAAAPIDAFQNATHVRIIGHLTLVQTAMRQSPHIFWTDRPSILTLYLVTLLRWLQLYPKGQTAWFDLTQYPDILALARKTETRAAIVAVADQENLGPTPFSAAIHATPLLGSAT
jgi:glutathione S-transferase